MLPCEDEERATRLWRLSGEVHDLQGGFLQVSTGGGGNDSPNNRTKPMRLTFGFFLAILLITIYLG